MKNNPFTSKIFTTIWSKHFNNSNPEKIFNFIENLSFVKNKYLPFYINIGKNLTNGLSYTIKKNEADYKNKVFFIYDVPSLVNITKPDTGTLKLITIRQYKGYLANLENYTNLQDYISDNFSSRSRKVFKKHLVKLETCFNIKYKMYYGDNITKDEYDFIFKNFNRLLKKRFSEKRINNHYLSDKKWNYLEALVFPMILDKKASIFVIYDKDTPINISVNYLSSNIVFGALTVFDTDYSKFNIGFIDIMKHLEWCIENKFLIFDFSKGDFEYKKRWGNTFYHFDYHLLYDSSSILAKLIANSLGQYFKIKQLLRDKNIHTRFHEFIFLLKGKKTKANTFNVLNCDGGIAENELERLDYNQEKYVFLKRRIYEFLYKHSESINDIEVYAVTPSQKTYFIKGKKNSIKLKFCEKPK
ncbi:GNAT family N-acetyltransferase [Gelatiniphilus marinus]|uniref:GNAT family N-acetyltransferase n=1 Tax=Gelatiniphilus marinus TaxID=1759464 RepID=A0ABW5JR62_9FLAO